MHIFFHILGAFIATIHRTKVLLFSLWLISVMDVILIPKLVSMEFVVKWGRIKYGWTGVLNRETTFNPTELTIENNSCDSYWAAASIEPLFHTWKCAFVTQKTQTFLHYKSKLFFFGIVLLTIKDQQKASIFLIFSGMPSSVDKIFKQPLLLLRSLTMLYWGEKESLSAE